MSASSKLISILLLATVMWGCNSGPKEQVRILDDEYRARAIKALNSSGIEYWQDEQKGIWFRAKDRAFVRSILDTQREISLSRVSIQRSNQAAAFRAELDNRGIEYQVKTTQEWPFVFFIEPARYSEAKQILAMSRSRSAAADAVTDEGY